MRTVSSQAIPLTQTQMALRVGWHSMPSFASFLVPFLSTARGCRQKKWRSIGVRFLKRINYILQKKYDQDIQKVLWQRKPTCMRMTESLDLVTKTYINLTSVSFCQRRPDDAPIAELLGLLLSWLLGWVKRKQKKSRCSFLFMSVWKVDNLIN